jgi:hypothetical protein
VKTQANDGLACAECKTRRTHSYVTPPVQTNFTRTLRQIQEKVHSSNTGMSGYECTVNVMAAIL